MLDLEIKPLEELPALDENNSSFTFVVDTNTYDSISYEDFFNNHLRRNIPCIIKNIGSNWDSSKKWVSNNQIDFEHLANRYGTLTVPVTDCKNITFDCQPRSHMKFSDYINYWRNSERDKLLYLKDWHLRRSKPHDTFYTVPHLFGSDWLNEYALDKQQDDFMFVYMGPANSWTPMHADVYRSFSWSVNVTGRKKWHLFPPGEEDKLQDNFKNVTLQFEPEKYADKNVVYYEIIQEKGDAIFVPSSWYHQVKNELDTISINHNWVNGCNISTVWQALTKILVSVEKEIDELKHLSEFPSMCQNMLKHLYGMDCEAFVKLITHIGEKRLAQLYDGSDNIAFNNFALGKNHCKYDLKCIHDVIKMITQHSTFVNNQFPIRENFLALQDCLTGIF